MGSDKQAYTNRTTLRGTPYDLIMHQVVICLAGKVQCDAWL